MIHNRTAEDTEYNIWVSGEARRVEEQFEPLPVKGRELQLVALQNWLVSQIIQAQITAYFIERQLHVAEDKEPDVRFESPRVN